MGSGPSSSASGVRPVLHGRVDPGKNVDPGRIPQRQAFGQGNPRLSVMQSSVGRTLACVHVSKWLLLVCPEPSLPSVVSNVSNVYLPTLQGEP